MEERVESLRKQRIPAKKRQECLKLFEEGYGYKKTAQLAGLNTYTVRDYKRRYVLLSDDQVRKRSQLYLLLNICWLHGISCGAFIGYMGIWGGLTLNIHIE